MCKNDGGDVPLGFCLKKKINLIYLEIENDIIVLKSTKLNFVINKNKKFRVGDIEKFIDLQLVKVSKMHLNFNNNKIILIDIIDDLESLLKS